MVSPTGPVGTVLNESEFLGSAGVSENLAEIRSPKRAAQAKWRPPGLIFRANVTDELITQLGCGRLLNFQVSLENLIFSSKKEKNTKRAETRKKTKEREHKNANS